MRTRGVPENVVYFNRAAARHHADGLVPLRGGMSM